MLDALATMLFVILTVGVLFFAREILVPIAIAVLLSFALSPLVKLLRRLGLGTRTAVGLVVVATFLIAVGLGVALAKQVTDLAAEAPKLQSVMLRKVEAVRSFAAENAMLGKINATIAAFQPAPPKGETTGQDTTGGEAVRGGPAKPEAGGVPAPLAPGAAKGPLPVEIVSPAPGVLSVLQTVIGMAASPLATAAFVAIFIVFILMQREDLRNRLIRLAGSGDLQRTTLAMNDAARRLSRYLLAQVLLNTGFGAVVAAGLTLIGVPSALLWGIVAAFMRFIPYIGSLGAALFPLLLATASDPGWAPALETAIFFALIEVITGQLIEPLVFGRNTGISPIAVIASATFWTWLWGPVGLVLSTPMTVCLVVMGRHISRLAFLDVLLGDAPALTQIEIFYQRMLAGDPSELLDHADHFLSERSLLDYCDEIAMKALLMAQGDVRRGVLDEGRQLRIRDAMRVLAQDLADREESAPSADRPASVVGGSASGHEAPGAVDPSWMAEGSVLCFAGRTALDEAAAHLLADVLHERGVGVRVEPADTLLRGLRPDHAADGPRLVVLSFLDADLSIVQAKVAVRRLRRRAPDVPLVAAFWMAETDEARLSALRENVHCDACASSLPQAVRLCLERADAAPRPAAEIRLTG